MRRRITVAEVEWLHDELIARSGGKAGVLSKEALESAVAAPYQSFDGNDLYPGAVEKAAMLCFFLVKNHPFLDGNKRTGFVTMTTVLRMEGCRLAGEDLFWEEFVVRLADGQLTRDEFVDTVASAVVRLKR